MAKKFKITEEQYNMLMNEELQINIEDPKNTGGNIPAAVEKTKEELKKHGVTNTEDIEITMSQDDASKLNTPNDNKNVNVPLSQLESKVISLKELRENRIKVLRENSQYYTLNDFIKKLK